MSISMDICQSDFISLIIEKATTLNLNVESSHYETNAEYYYNHHHHANRYVHVV
jgi:hypothetical protein